MVGKICRRPVFIIGRNSSVFSSRHWHPRQLPVCPVSRVHRRCDGSVSLIQDDSSLNETLTSQRATRHAGWQDSRVHIFGERGDEKERPLETVQPYSRVCGRMTRGGWQGTWGTSSTGWRMEPRCVAKTLEQAAPLPVEVNTTVSSIWASSGARPQILTLLFCSLSRVSHRQTACFSRVHAQSEFCKMSA